MEEEFAVDSSKKSSSVTLGSTIEYESRNTGGSKIQERISKGSWEVQLKDKLMLQKFLKTMCSFFHNMHFA